MRHYDDDASMTYEGSEDDPLACAIERLGDRVELDHDLDGVTVRVDGRYHSYCRRSQVLDVLREVEAEL